ncbi:hypothetical protein OUZ56_016198 [Daphnia magna]|uniref:Uncharacterized protein n=1 Tax=Daphnia magna TaxID=35525 RepID=A0ABR0APZ0_9CRUS|nr:hypothetical protein OUZ56_016198 [Daphnia magna]
MAIALATQVVLMKAKVSPSQAKSESPHKPSHKRSGNGGKQRTIQRKIMDPKNVEEISTAPAADPTPASTAIPTYASSVASAAAFTSAPAPNSAHALEDTTPAPRQKCKSAVPQRVPLGGTDSRSWRISLAVDNKTVPTCQAFKTRMPKKNSAKTKNLCAANAIAYNLPRKAKLKVNKNAVTVMPILETSGEATEANSSVNVIDLEPEPETVSKQVDNDSIPNALASSSVLNCDNTANSIIHDAQIDSVVDVVAASWAEFDAESRNGQEFGDIPDSLASELPGSELSDSTRIAQVVKETPVSNTIPSKSQGSTTAMERYLTGIKGRHGFLKGSTTNLRSPSLFHKESKNCFQVCHMISN